MAKKNRSKSVGACEKHHHGDSHRLPADPATLREMLNGLHVFINEVAKSLQESVQLAKAGNIKVFDGLFLLLQHLDLDRRLVPQKAGQDAALSPMAIPEAVTPALSLVIRSLDGKELRKQLLKLSKAVENWKPVRREQAPYKRPPILLGDPAEVAEEEERIRREILAAEEKLYGPEREVIRCVQQGVTEVIGILDKARTCIEQAVLGWEPRKGRKMSQEEFEMKLSADVVANLERYKEFVEGIAANNKTLIELARRTYGRNALARKYGVAQGTVSNSVAWKKIRDDLQLNRGTSGGRPRKIGLEMAIEKAAQIDKTSVVDQADRNECQACIEENFSRGNITKEEKEKLEEGLEDGILSTKRVKEKIAERSAQ